MMKMFSKWLFVINRILENEVKTIISKKKKHKKKLKRNNLTSLIAYEGIEQ